MTTDSYDVPDPFDDQLDEEPPPALGQVVEEGRGALPFELIHGEALVACASWALGDAGVTPVDLGTPWEAVVESGEAYVVHDSLCPMTPSRFISGCVATALERDAVVVGVRPVTDTVATVAAGTGSERVTGSVDREELLSVASPLVLPPSVVAALSGLPSLDFPSLDLPVLVAGLAARFTVVTVPAPPSARRVGTVAELRVLEALTTPARH